MEDSRLQLIDISDLYVKAYLQFNLYTYKIIFTFTIIIALNTPPFSDITVAKLGNICEELSPFNYRWRFSSSCPGSFIMISQHAITVSATGAAN
jgi:hypothetical protein